MKGFLTELRRRNVYRVAAIYVIVAWLVLQVVDVFMEFMPLPAWTNSLVFVLLVAGFPVALVLAWAFELTPAGIRVEAGQPATPRHRNRAWDWLLGGALTAIVAWWVWNQFAPSTPEPSMGKAAIGSIVVLPLDNLMNDPGQAYFVEGMHDALITELSRIKNLRVISRTSAMRYQDSDQPVPVIARELGVDAVVEGSVLRAGDKVRINVQMIDAVNDRHLWGEQFDRDLTDILALYSDVTRKIADSIRIQLSPGVAAHLENTAPLDAGAYDQYLKGLSLCDTWTPDSMLRGIELMRKAVRRNPDFAPHHAGLAQCLQYASFYEYVAPADIEHEALQEADRAVQLDPGLDAGYVARASVYWYLDYHQQAAEDSLLKALDLNPSMTRAIIHYSWFLGENGRFDEAEKWARKALELEPFNTQTHVTLGQVQFLRRDFAAAKKNYQAALDLDERNPTSHLYLAWVLDQDGDFEAAIGHLRRAAELSGGEPIYLAFLGYTLARAGQREAAQAALEQIRGLTGPGAGQPFHYGLIHLGLDEYQEAVDWFEQAYEARNSHMVYLGQAPQFDALRGNERFQRLLVKMGFE